MVMNVVNDSSPAEPYFATQLFSSKLILGREHIKQTSTTIDPFTLNPVLLSIPKTLQILELFFYIPP